MVSARRNSGFALLEVLIALVILLVGLLGLMALQMKTGRAQVDAYQHEQALVLLQDMLDRINANRETAPCYAVTTGTGTPYLGTGSTVTIQCTGYGDVNTQAQAVQDLTDWNAELNGAAEHQGTTAVGGLIGARGCISLIDPTNQVYRVAVAWQGLDDTVAPSVDCGDGLYGAETLRRVVSADVRIASLTAP